MKDFLKGIVYVCLFTVPFIPLIVTDTMFFPFITGKNFTFRIVVEVAFIAWTLLALLDTAYRPRFSWILAGASSFIVVMFFANFLGEYPLKSFWSNFERMDGYVTLVHFFMLFVVLGSVFRDKKIWLYYIGACVAAASYVAFDGLQQYINQEGSWRIDSTLGNAAYMAVYMLFQTFFAVWLFIHSKHWWVRGLLALLFILFSYLLLLTATRGTFIGLAGGLSLAALYLVVFSKAYPVFRKVALGALAVLIIFVGSIFVFKDSEFVSDNRALTRIASINLEKDLAVRMDIWGMAYDGFKERPILGWGQGNFNYIFNDRYDPDLYLAEAWYDRAHNIVLDWLVAGGILGFLTYMSIFVALLYYLFWRPLFLIDGQNDDGYFTVPERAVLLGLLGGYFVHNLVVFDNIVSYIFFASVLGLIHARISEEMPQVQNFTIDKRIVTNIIAPVVVVLGAISIWFVNMPGIQASSDIIDALTANTIPDRLSEMQSAIDRDSFAYQEVVEQFAQQAMQIGANPNIPPEQKEAFINAAEKELLQLAKDKPGDARVHVFISGFYRNIGNLSEAKRQADIAHELSPTKQAIIIEQGVIAYQMQDYEAMHEYFKEAFELQPEYKLARTFYATSFLFLNQPEQAEELLTDEADFAFFAKNDFALNSANQFNQHALLARMLEVRLAENPNNAQTVASLAFVYHQAGNTDKAIEILKAGVERLPDFAERGSCYVANLEAGNPPDEGCQ